MARHVLMLTVAATLLGCGEGDSTPPSTSSADGSATTTGPAAEASTNAESGSTAAVASGEETVDTTGGDDPPETDPCLPGDRPAIEIGHGEVVFEPFDAHPAELVYGVQGGYHIVVGVRGVYTDNGDVSVLRMTGFIDGEELAFSAPYVELRCIEDQQEAANLLLIWDTTPEALHGKTALIQAELTDASGAVYAAEGEVVIDDPTMN